MPWTKSKKTYKPRRKAGKGMRRAKPRSRSPRVHIFTEMTNLGPLNVTTPSGSGFQFGVRIDDLPQALQYSALFTQYKILRSKLVFVPRATTTDTSVYSAATASGVGQTRMVYAIQDSPDYSPPGNEAVAMALNGCKIRSLNRPLSITYRPVPRLNQQDGTSGLDVGVGNKPLWINFDGGIDTLHYGVSAWVTPTVNATASLPLSVCDVYAYITFACRDPR